MARFKKIIAAAAAAAMTFGLAGCTDTSYVMTYGDEKINAGIYIYELFNEMSYQMTMLYYTDGITEDYFSQEIDGQSFSDYLSDTALQSTKEYAAIVSKFEELGLELTDDELEEITTNLRDMWDSYGDLYEKEGISKESAKLVLQSDTMWDKIFDYYYAQGGVEEVTDSDIEQYLNDNYIRYKSISISKSTNEDETAKAEEDEEALALRDEYLEMAEGLTFDEFDSVIDEYDAYLAALAEEEAAEEEESETSDDSSAQIATVEPQTTDDSSADDSSAADSEADDSEISQASNETSVDATLEDSSAADSESDDSTADDSQSGLELDESGEIEAVDADELSDETEEADEAADETAEDDTLTDSVEEDPYPNDILVNYGDMDDETKETDSGKLAAEVDSLELDVASAYEDDYYYYIIIKGDMSERSAEYAEENHDSMVSEMKYDEFDEKISGWIDELDLKENSEAIKRYTPEIVYEKQQEYYEENS